jgi:hypothetical protein
LLWLVGGVLLGAGYSLESCRFMLTCNGVCKAQAKNNQVFPK